MLLTVSRAPNHTLKLLTRDRCLTEINLTHPRFHRDMTRTPIREAVQHYLLTWVRKVWGGGSPEIQASPRHPKCSSHSISLNRGYRLKVPQVHTRSDMVTRGAPPCYSLTPRRSPPKQAGPSKPRAPSAVLSSAGPARTRKGWRPRPRSGGRCGRGQVWPGPGGGARLEDVRRGGGARGGKGMLALGSTRALLGLGRLPAGGWGSAASTRAQGLLFRRPPDVAQGWACPVARKPHPGAASEGPCSGRLCSRCELRGEAGTPLTVMPDARACHTGGTRPVWAKLVRAHDVSAAPVVSSAPATSRGACPPSVGKAQGWTIAPIPRELAASHV